MEIRLLLDNLDYSQHYCHISYPGVGLEPDNPWFVMDSSRKYNIAVLYLLLQHQENLWIMNYIFLENQFLSKFYNSLLKIIDDLFCPPTLSCHQETFSPLKQNHHEWFSLLFLSLCVKNPFSVMDKKPKVKSPKFTLVPSMVNAVYLAS